MSNSTPLVSKKNQVGIAEFNPDNLPETKFGKCENTEHNEWCCEFDPPTKLQLIMLYTDEYSEKWCGCSEKHKLSDEEFDKKMDEMDKIKWLKDSEAYYCEGCVEMLTDAC